jgi:predicted DNA-binding transcriptional regulator YafY
MPQKISKTQRWLDLISYLLGRRYPVAVGELMERLPAYARLKPETARRYLERDKDELRAVGIPIAYTDGTEDGGSAELQGYYLRSHDFFLPYLKVVRGEQAPRTERGQRSAGSLRLAPEDVADVVEALQRIATLPESPFAADARAAYAKLVLDLDTSTLGEAPIHIAESPGAAASRATLNALSDALVERRTVRMRYRAAKQTEATERAVDPYGLIASGGHWYLVGHCHARGEERQFRVDRIESLTVPQGTGNRAAPSFTVPADFSITRYAHRRPWELGGEVPTEARVRFRSPWSLWAERNGYGELEQTEADGAAVRRFRVLSSGPFLRWLLSTEADVELLGPPALAAELQDLACAVAALYENEV